MQVKNNPTSDTEAILTIKVSQEELNTVKQHVLKQLAPQLKLPGFRPGKAPLELIEKNIDANTFQTEFLEQALNDLYPEAVRQAGIRPVDRPEIELKKFVPYSTLEFTAKVAVIGDIKLPDYKKHRKQRPKVNVTAKDVDEVIAALRQRSASRQSVDRAAKKNDEAVIDFKGVDDKGAAVSGADATDYPLLLGSNAFIPGFEDNVIGMKVGEEKTFKLTFPADYSVKALASRKITFTVKLKIVNEVVLPELDDKFAASVGPVKTVQELRDDIKRELQVERQRQADLDFESELVKELSDKTKVNIPSVLIDDQVERLFREVQQNLMYRGQTIKEFLASEAKSEAEYKDKVLRPQAEDRVKASLMLAEVAEREKLQVMPEELEVRLQALKSQYTDAQMQAELNKPENQREIASRMLSEKTVAALADFAANKK